MCSLNLENRFFLTSILLGFVCIPIKEAVFKWHL